MGDNIGSCDDVSNDPCWCKGGKKHKKCHLPSDERGEIERKKMRKPTVTAGTVSSTRAVPGRIARPEYAATGVPGPYKLSCVKVTDGQIARMRKAGGVARKVLDAVLAEVRPGVATDELDRIAHELIVASGG